MKTRIDQIEKENQSLKIRIGQIEAADLTRHQELIKQSKRNDKIEGNWKYVTERITDQENRLKRDNLRIIVLPEKGETNKNLDIILQEIFQENALIFLNKRGKYTLKETSRDQGKLQHSSHVDCGESKSNHLSLPGESSSIKAH